MRARIPGLLLGSLFLALAACNSPNQGGGKALVLQRARQGDFDKALEEAERLLARTPGDAGLLKLRRDVQVAAILDRGRREVFREELDSALETLLEAERLDPENQTVQAWIRKTRLQLADEWLDRAAELTGPDRLEEVRHAYERVLENDPGNPTAVDGLARTLLLMNYRSGQSMSYFKQGLTGFRRLQLEQARRDFQISNEYRENDAARERAEQVEKMLAEERLSQAQEFERAGFYFAAGNEYRLVLLADPDNREARAGLDRMDREARASQTVAEAEMAMRRGELEQAEEALQKAAVLTEVQKDAVSLLQSGIEEKGFEELYDRARSLSDDYRYPEAVAAYDELLAVAPHFRDADLRKATLEEFIALTEDFYAKALAAGTDEEAEDYLRAIHPVIWPEYKDVVERLEAIEARRAAAQAPAAKAPATPADPDPDSDPNPDADADADDR